MFRRTQTKSQLRETAILYVQTEPQNDLSNPENEILTQNPLLSLLAKVRTKHDINICDCCEQASDDLVETDGKWLCEECREYEG